MGKYVLIDKKVSVKFLQENRKRTPVCDEIDFGKTNRTKEGVLFMYISIQHFLEKGIKKLKEVEKHS